MMAFISMRKSHLSIAFLIPVASFVAKADSPGDREFFESRIRPVLAEHCYECHNSINKASSGLALDYKGG